MQAADESESEKRKIAYDHTAIQCSFNLEDKVLYRIQGRAHRLAASWEGPYLVIKILDPVTYRIKEVDGIGQIKTTHVNNLKPFKESSLEVCSLILIADEKDTLPVKPITTDTHHPDFNSEQFSALVSEFSTVFQHKPGQCSVALVNIPIPVGTPVISQPACRLAENIKPKVQHEIQNLLDLNILEPSTSD